MEWMHDKFSLTNFNEAPCSRIAGLQLILLEPSSSTFQPSCSYCSLGALKGEKYERVEKEINSLKEIHLLFMFCITHLW